jgi:hypothetical protein
MRHVWVNDTVHKVEVWTNADHSTLQVRKRVGHDTQVVAVGDRSNYEIVLQHNIHQVTKQYPSQINQEEDAVREPRPESLDVRQQSQDGEGVGEEDSQGEETSQKEEV